MAERSAAVSSCGEVGGNGNEAAIIGRSEVSEALHQAYGGRRSVVKRGLLSVRL